jgi:FKBP-type peptidyl-prolyl cis-trans isomerase FkpA
MKRTPLFALSIAAVLAGCTGKSGSGTGAGPVPQTEDQKTLYALGLILGRNLQTFNMTPEELDFVKKGLTDQVQNKPTDVKLDDYGPKVQALARTRATSKAETEKKSGEALAAKAAAEPGAQKFPSGLVMKSMKEGTGPSPGATDRVKVHYHGTLENGTVFDSSVQRGQPAEFALNQVIPCWTEGVQKLKVGGKSKLVCPSSIAYGDMGRPGIPGGATLIFEVELISIEGPGAAPGMPPGMPGGMPGGMSKAPPGAPKMMKTVPK